MRENLKGAKAAILFVGIATLVMSLAGAMMPALTRVFVDRVLSGRSPSWATGITVLMAILCIVMLVTGWTQSVYQMKRVVGFLSPLCIDLWGKMAVKVSEGYFVV